MVKINKLLNFIYPPKCIICNKVLKSDSQVNICSVCMEQLPFIKGKSCYKCGKKLESYKNIYCFDCRNRDHYFDRGISVFEYKEPIKFTIITYKTKGKLNYTNTFVSFMVERYLGEKLNTPDIILPVPSSKETKRKKGYNHSECLAKVIGKILNIEYKNNVLLKGRNTTMQKGLHYLERLENLKDAFYIKNAEIINNKVLLLIDDIYTTGATTDECSKILKENGAKEVQILTLAIGKGFS